MNAEGMDVISLGIRVTMPPSKKTIRTLCEAACNPDGHGYMPYVVSPNCARFCRLVPKMVRCSIESQHRDTTAHRLQRRHPARGAGLCQPPVNRVLVLQSAIHYTSLVRFLGAEVVNYGEKRNGWMPDPTNWNGWT